MGTRASLRRPSCCTLVLVSALAWAADAQSGYFFADLHPGPGFESCAILSTSGGIRVGQLQVGPGNPYYSNSFFQGGLWIGLDPQVKVLTPTAYFAGSIANGVAAGQIAGYANTSYPAAHAAIWDADGSNFVDLNPANCFFSNAYGTTGTRQVGSGFILTPTFQAYHAFLWAGSAESVVDLNPPDKGKSFAYGIAGDQQVGEAESYFGEPQAYLWHGTAESGVELNPAGALASIARHTDGAHQVGEVHFKLGAPHAALWSGTADSFVDLNPPDSSAARPIRTSASGRLAWATSPTARPTPSSGTAAQTTTSTSISSPRRARRVRSPTTSTPSTAPSSVAQRSTASRTPASGRCPNPPVCRSSPRSF